MYSSQSRPEAIAHRGLHTTFPENSIPAFLAAIETGADGIELDIQSSADDVLFVHHDATLSTANEIRPLNELDAAEIAKVRLASDIFVPTLDGALEAIGNKARVYIEVKARGIEHTLVRCLRRHAAYVAAYSVHSFDHRTVKRLLELFPAVETGILQVSYLVDSAAVMRATGATDLWQHADFIDPALVVDVHARGGRVIAWTPNSEADWERLYLAGVDSVCTDRVGDYVAWRKSSGAASASEGFGGLPAGAPRVG